MRAHRALLFVALCCLVAVCSSLSSSSVRRALKQRRAGHAHAHAHALRVRGTPDPDDAKGPDPRLAIGSDPLTNPVFFHATRASNVQYLKAGIDPNKGGGDFGTAFYVTPRITDYQKFMSIRDPVLKDVSDNMDFAIARATVTNFWSLKSALYGSKLEDPVGNKVTAEFIAQKWDDSHNDVMNVLCNTYYNKGPPVFSRFDKWIFYYANRATPFTPVGIQCHVASYAELYALAQRTGPDATPSTTDVDKLECAEYKDLITTHRVHPRLVFLHGTQEIAFKPTLPKSAFTLLDKIAYFTTLDYCKTDAVATDEPHASTQLSPEAQTGCSSPTTGLHGSRINSGSCASQEERIKCYKLDQACDGSGTAARCVNPETVNGATVCSFDGRLRCQHDGNKRCVRAGTTETCEERLRVQVNTGCPPPPPSGKQPLTGKSGSGGDTTTKEILN